MSNFLKQVIKKKLKQISSHDILYYGEQYGFSLSEHETQQVANYIKNHDLDPFNETDRQTMFHALSQITNEKTAQNAEDLLFQLMKTYGLDHLF